MSPANADSEYGKAIRENLEKFESAMPGSPAINFFGTDFRGEKFELKNFEGKYILIDFWASWCKPCREKNPELIKIYNKYKDDGFAIVG